MTMPNDIGLGMGVPMTHPLGVPIGTVMDFASPYDAIDVQRHSMSKAQTTPSRRRKIIQDETLRRSRADSVSISSDYFRSRCSSQSDLQTLVAMRSSRVMEDLQFAETGASTVELDQLSAGGRPESVSKEGKRVEPGEIDPLTFPIALDDAPAVRPRSRVEHVRGMSLDQGLYRHGTILSSAPSSPLRRAEQLSVLLGDGSGKVRSSAFITPRPRTVSTFTYASTNKSKASLNDVNAVTFEQGRSRARVSLDIELENNVVVEGGYISGTLSVHVRPKRKDDLLMLGGGKIRIAGFEVAPKNEDRCIFYQVAAPLREVSPGCAKLFKTGLDDEGFGCVSEGEYSIRFAMQIPTVGASGKPRGSLNSRSATGATIKYIIIASMKVLNPSTGRRSIAHFYRDCEVWPILDPPTTLAPAPDPMLARAEKRLFMGGDGTLALTASLHRSTWVAGQPVHVRLRISNETKKSVRSVSLGLIRTTTLFKLDGSVQHRAVAFEDDMDEGEACTSERKVAEAVLSAGQKGARGRASAKGWWTGVSPGETRNVTHSIILPADALTIPRARLIEVDYTVRVALGVSSIAGTSEAVHVTLPIRVVNSISLDPPPSEPIPLAATSTVIELDTPKLHKYSISELALSGKESTGTLQDGSTEGHCGEPVHTEKRTVLKRTRANTLPYDTMPTRLVNDLGSVEDADNLNGVLGDLPGSTSLLEEVDIALDGADSGYSEGSYEAECGRLEKIRRTKSGCLRTMQRNPSGAEDHRESFIDLEDEEEEEDVGSDEEVERMVGCASARIDHGSFDHSMHAHTNSGTSSSEVSASDPYPSGGLRHDPAHPPSSFPREGITRAQVRGPRAASVHMGNEGGGEHGRSALMRMSLHSQGIKSKEPILPVSNTSRHSLFESPDAYYSTSHPGSTRRTESVAPSSRPPSHPTTPTPQAKRLRTLPTPPPPKPTTQNSFYYSQRSSSLPRPTTLRASTTPLNTHKRTDSSAYDSGYSSSSSPTRSIPIPGLPFPSGNNETGKPAIRGSRSRASSVRSCVAVHEGKNPSERELPMMVAAESASDLRPGYVSRSLTTGAVFSYAWGSRRN